MVKKLSQINTIYFNVEGDDTQYGYVEFYYDLIADNGDLLSKDYYRIQPSTDYSGYEERVRTMCDAAFATMTEYTAWPSDGPPSVIIPNQ